MSFITPLFLKLWNWYKSHDGDASAHHTKYTDAEAVSAVNTDDKYLKKDGSVPLTADWDIGNGIKILADEIRARDVDGLKLYDDGGKGIFVKDGGQVGIGTTTPDASALLHIKGGWVSTYMQIETPASQSVGAILKNGARMWTFKIAAGGNFIFRDISGGSDRFIITTSGVIDFNSNLIRLRTAKTPASATSAGNQGNICWDANYVYVCVSVNSWKRSALSTW